MMKNQEEVFINLFHAYEETGSLDEAIKSLNLSEDQRKTLNRVFGYLDSFDEKYKNLEEAKENQGISREAWMKKEIVNSAKERGEDDDKTASMLHVVTNVLKKIQDKTYDDSEGEED